VHLCVWTKFDLEDDPKTGELMPQMRRQIDEYVNRTFKSRVPVENVSEIQFILVLLNLLYTYGVDIDIPILKVIWFKNWSSLKSIHSMEHFHVMLHDPDPEFIREVTNGDSAVSSQLPNWKEGIESWKALVFLPVTRNVDLVMVMAKYGVAIPSALKKGAIF